VPAVVIGAGVIGCAIAQKLAEQGRDPIILEQGLRIAEGVTSRNSGVIHAGIYYPSGSLKSQTCLRGKNLLKSWCQKHDVPWLETGKWIVAQDDEIETLEELFAHAKNAGATGLSLKGKNEITRHLPDISAAAAIFSAETGIVDAHAFSASLLAAAESKGATLILQSRVQSIDVRSRREFIIETTRGRLKTELVFNAAGLFSDEIARMAGVNNYQIFPWRGDYFRLRKKPAVHSLIYPVRKKNAAGLGVHLTLDLGGNFRLGPDAEYVSCKSDFTPRPEKQSAFLQAARLYLPGLQLEDLEYDTCGIRPKLRSLNDNHEVDFIIKEDPAGFVNLIGIESPGLTAAIALAENALLAANLS